ncbi:hypothetical protein [Streptomyces hilarionis]|uniref:hypothetical protein n=1 Tax=Streptomyces hilarionis TaxID=2839954 RepID=UPI00211A5261|nr:hypothetical protein [Streptomyces hilarionis]MCQ9135610.1 hypothetical protein [Streptomyces hilarionis]
MGAASALVSVPFAPRAGGRGGRRALGLAGARSADGRAVSRGEGDLATATRATPAAHPSG